MYIMPVTFKILCVISRFNNGVLRLVKSVWRKIISKPVVEQDHVLRRLHTDTKRMRQWNASPIFAAT